MIQSREAWDWIINSLLSGLRSSLLGGYGSYYELCIKGTETFLFGGISPPNKNIFLCVLCASVVKNVF